MAVTITAVTLVGGTPPTQVRITGSYSNCEKLDIWVSCNQTNPGRQASFYSGASPFTIDINLPKSCGCGDTIWVWVDCHQGLGAPSSAAANHSLAFDCDCCPLVSIAAPTVNYPGGVPTASFALAMPVSWVPAGCTPPVNITGYLWTVTQGTAEYRLTTATAQASTDTGNWTIGTSGTAATVPLPLAAGSWDVKVRPVFSAGVLSSACDTSDSTTFMVGGTPPQCCPFDAKSAPHGVSVTVVVTGTPPNAKATFTAAVHWPKKCTAVTPSQYVWEVTDPSGNKYSRETPANITYSNDAGANWKLNGVPVGALPLNSGGTYVVVCTVVFPANTTATGCPTFGSAPFPVAGMPPPPPPSCCPTVNLNATITGTTANFSVTSAWPAGCTNIAPTSFAWTVTDKSTNTTFVKTTTTATTDQTGFSPALTLTPGDNYDVSVTPTFPGVTLPQGCNSTGMSTFQAPGGTTPPPPPGSSSGFSICALLLVLSIVLLLLGGIVFVIGWCIAVIWVWIVGAAIAFVGLVLFLVWAFLCAKQTPCTLMWTMECILDWIVRTAWIIAVIAFIFGGSLPCGLAAISAWGGWAVLDNVLRTVMFRAGCPPIDCTKPRP